MGILSARHTMTSNQMARRGHAMLSLRPAASRWAASRWAASRWAAPLLALAVLLSTGCAVNPATGQRQLVLIGEQQEIAMGREADKQIVQQMGLYPDDELQAYMQELGSRLAAESERPDLPWTFRVIDDPIVNAFALPGGFIYITRGIMSHFNSEAELVSVLGHEIGHVTGKHGVERASKAQLASIGIGVAAIAGAGDYAQLASQGLGLLFLKFSRDDERQADDLGLRYLSRGGYYPGEMPKVFRTLERVSAAQGGGRIPAWLATHPDPGNRAERISQQIANLPPDPNRVTINRDSYLERLEGMTFGDDPAGGYLVGNTFYHPVMKFQLDFPEGWQVNNQRQAVGAMSPNKDAIVVLSLAPQDTAEEAIRAFYAQEGIERGDNWRQGGFSYFRTAPNQAQRRIVGLAGFFPYAGEVFQLLTYTQDDKWSPNSRAMEQAIGSFRRLTDRRYLDVEAKKVDIVRLDRAMTLEEFHRRYPSTIDLEALAILNGVAATDRLERGQRIKRVVGGELPKS
ncbi:MAG: M48 family metalloprotease [Acidobacteriota bacterium]